MEEARLEANEIMELDDAGSNIRIGLNAGDSISSASGVIAIGENAGTNITSSSNAIMIGKQAGQNHTSATSICIGENAGQINTGTNNLHIGSNAGRIGSGGNNYNVSVGYRAFYDMGSGFHNVAMGYEALGGTSSSNTYDNNVAIGYHALWSNTAAFTGDGNVAVGSSAGDSITSGTNNTAIGFQADCAATGTNQIACGAGAVASGSNVGIWGNASVATNNITVDWTVTSDERIKDNIEDASLGLDFINALKPKTYTRKHPADWDEAILEDRFKEGGSEYDEEKGAPIKGEFDTEKIHNGLIAQEVKAAMDSLGVNFSGWSEDSNGKQGIQYAALVMPLIKAVQELSAKVKQLENK